MVFFLVSADHVEHMLAKRHSPPPNGKNRFRRLLTVEFHMRRRDNVVDLIGKPIRSTEIRRIEMVVNSRLVLITTAAALALSCSLLSHRTVIFEGISMLPTIKNGDRLQTIKLNAKSRAQLVRGDIIAFRYPMDPSKAFVKRLIGLPGDTIEIQKGDVWINGTRLLEPYVDPKLNMSQRSQPPMSIPQQATMCLETIEITPTTLDSGVQCPQSWSTRR